jgi:CBS domain-containing protein
MAEMDSMRHLFGTGLPIAERIGLELTIWGSISSAVLIVLAVIGISILGQIIRRMAENSRPASENYQGIVTRWDLMRVPADQGLLLASLAGAGVVLSLVFWAVLPVTTPNPHDCCKKPEIRAEPAFKPIESLNKNAQRIASLAAQVDAMEQKAETKGRKEKAKGKTESGTAKGLSADTKP